MHELGLPLLGAVLLEPIRDELVHLLRRLGVVGEHLGQRAPRQHEEVAERARLHGGGARLVDDQRLAKVVALPQLGDDDGRAADEHIELAAVHKVHLVAELPLPHDRLARRGDLRP